MTTKNTESSTDIGLDSAKQATSLLLLAAEMEEPVKRVCHHLLEPEKPGEAGIIKVSYHFSPAEIADRWLENNPESQDRLYCLSVGDRGMSQLQTGNDNIAFATCRADDLTGLGMKLNQIVDELGDNTSEIRVCLDSLDSMVMYTDEQTVYRFMRTISNFLSSNNARVHFHLDPHHNVEVVNILRSAVNAVIEVDETGITDIRIR